MRESLEISRVLHEAEAVVERHERIPVEVAQGPAEGNTPHLADIGHGRVPVAPRAVERTPHSPTAGLAEHAQLPAARGAAPTGAIAGCVERICGVEGIINVQNEVLYAEKRGIDLGGAEE